MLFLKTVMNLLTKSTPLITCSTLCSEETRLKPSNKLKDLKLNNNTSNYLNCSSNSSKILSEKSKTKTTMMKFPKRLRKTTDSSSWAHWLICIKWLTLLKKTPILLTIFLTSQLLLMKPLKEPWKTTLVDQIYHRLLKKSNMWEILLLISTLWKNKEELRPLLTNNMIRLKENKYNNRT